jgi:hypothetical protein
MSQQYDNTNRGVLFKNKNKKSEKQPDYRGHCELGDDVIAAAREGKEIAISGWIKTIQNGKSAGDKMLSITLQPPYEEGGQGGRRQQSQGNQRSQGGQRSAVQDMRQQKRENPPAEPFGDDQFDENDIPF